MKNKLTKKFKEKWIAALRSGSYEQGKSYLFDGEGYCCLGVACALVGVQDSLMEDRSWPWYLKGYLPNNFPKLLLEDITNYNPDHPTSRQKTPVTKLAAMNDHGRSFKYIANWIEKNL